jgi:hypothetical protein
MASKRKSITSALSKALEYHLNPNCDPRFYIAKEITFDYSSVHPIRVDYMQFKPLNNSISGIEKGDFYCYEIKSSVEDFKSKNGHNFIGDYNYYVMTAEVYQKVAAEIPWNIGVLVIGDEQLGSDFPRFDVIKKPRRENRSRPATEMLLMMFRSANRENIKIQKKEKDKKVAEFLEKTIEANHQSHYDKTVSKTR